LIERSMLAQDDVTVLLAIYRQRRNQVKYKRALSKYKSKLLKFISRIKNSVENDKISLSAKKLALCINKYYTEENGYEELTEALENFIAVQRMLGKAKEVFDNDLLVEEYIIDKKDGIIAKIKTFSVIDYLTKVLGSEEWGYALDYGILCCADYKVPQLRKRFVIIGVDKKISEEVLLPRPLVSQENYCTVEDAIIDIEDVEPLFNNKDDTGRHICNEKSNGELSKLLRDSPTLYNHIITTTKTTALDRFAMIKPGENFHSLESSMKENTYTDISRTQNTIYLRLDYTKPSGTVVNVRKSMWIHPKHNRAVSIREAARLQTFQDSYIFKGTKDSQYQQIGNAVPPLFAKAIAEHLLHYLNKRK